MAAAVREIREELGIGVRVTGYLGAWLDRYPATERNEAQVTLNVYYLGELQNDVVAWDRSEVASLGWFERAKLPRDLVPHVRPVLEAFYHASSRDDNTLLDRPAGVP